MKFGYTLPVVCYGVMGLWLVVTTAILLKLYNPGFPYEFLAALNGIAHYATILSVTVIGIAALGKRKTISLVLFGIIIWEVFEWVTLPLWASNPGYTMHLADTLSDLTLDLFGMLTALFDQLR